MLTQVDKHNSRLVIRFSPFHLEFTAYNLVRTTHTRYKLIQEIQILQKNKLSCMEGTIYRRNSLNGHKTNRGENAIVCFPQKL